MKTKRKEPFISSFACINHLINFLLNKSAREIPVQAIELLSCVCEYMHSFMIYHNWTKYVSRIRMLNLVYFVLLSSVLWSLVPKISLFFFCRVSAYCLLFSDPLRWVTQNSIYLTLLSHYHNCISCFTLSGVYKTQDGDENMNIREVLKEDYSFGLKFDAKNQYVYTY
jgi:hypothetical protein